MWLKTPTKNGIIVCEIKHDLFHRARVHFVRSYDLSIVEISLLFTCITAKPLSTATVMNTTSTSIFMCNAHGRRMDDEVEGRKREAF